MFWSLRPTLSTSVPKASTRFWLKKDLLRTQNGHGFPFKNASGQLPATDTISHHLSLNDIEIGPPEKWKLY